MTLTTALYLTDFLNNIDCLLALLFGLGCMVMLVAGFGKALCQDRYIDNNGTFERLWTAILKKWFIVLILGIICCLLPNKNTMYMMLGASYLQDSTLPSKVSQALEIKLDEYIKELTKKDKQ
jgi:hypothetical protein